MKIVLFTVGFGGGGAEQVFVALANHWKQCGHDVRFWVVNNAGPMKARLSESIPVRAIGRGRRGLQRYTASRTLRRMLREDQPDLAFSTLTYANCLMGAAARSKPAGVRVVLREANSFANLKKSGLLRYYFTLWLMRKNYPRADAIIANAESMAEELRQHLPDCCSAKLQVIPNPVEVDASPGAPLTKKLPAPGRRRIIACGRLIPQKGFADLLDAVAKLPAVLPWDLIILGEGPLRAELEKQSVRLKINDRVEFPGFVEDVRSWLRGADLFVLSSHWEGFPNALVEAMACGVTPVATDSPGAASAILGPWAETNSVPVADTDGLAKTILFALDQTIVPDLLRAHVTSNYAFDVVAERYRTITESSTVKTGRQ